MGLEVWDQVKGQVVGVFKLDQRTKIYRLIINDPFKRFFIVVSNKDPLAANDYLIFDRRNLNEPLGFGKIEYENNEASIIFNLPPKSYRVALKKGKKL